MHTLEDKKGENIVLIDLREIAIFADYFVICSGNTDRMIQGLADSAIDNCCLPGKTLSAEGQSGNQVSAVYRWSFRQIPLFRHDRSHDPVFRSDAICRRVLPEYRPGFPDHVHPIHVPIVLVVFTSP